MARQMSGEMSVPHSEATTSTKYIDQPSSYQWNLEAIIPKVVRAMSDDDQIERLGRALGFEYSDIKKFITMNQMEREVASGTKVMLRKWAEKVSVTRQQEALRDALRKAGLVQIEEKCLPNQAEPPTFPSSSTTENKGTALQLWSKPIQSTSSIGETDPHDEGGVAVHWEFVTDAPEDFILQEDEAEITCGVRFSPSGATFEEPVRVTMEHCAHFTDPSQAEIVFYTRSRGMTSFERIPASTKGYPRCDVRRKDLDLYVHPFCQWRIATKFTEYFKGKRVKCTPYVEPPVIEGTVHVVLLYIYDDRPEIEMKVEEEMTGYIKLHPPMSFFVAWRSGDVFIRLFEGPRRCRTLVNEKVIREQDFHQVLCNPQSFLVEPPIGEANQKPLQFVLRQGRPNSPDAEMLIVLRYDDRVQPSPPPSPPPPPQSQTPSSSSSLPQSPLPPPSQPLLPSSLQPSSSSEPSSPLSVSQGELIKLAEDVPTRKYTELCNNMGFCPASSEQLLNKHSKDYKQALIEILCVWLVNQETGNSRRHLTDILQNTCLLTLAGRVETGHYLSTFDFDECEEPSAEPPTFPSSSVTENKGKTPQLWSKSIQSTPSMRGTDSHDQGVAVHWEFITDAPEDFILQEDEAEIACGIRFSPSGATFKEPVKVTMEHCAHFTDPSQAEIVFYTRSRGMTSFERIPASTKGYPRCDVRTKDLDLYVDHFCQWRIATKFNEYFKGKRVKCTPYVEPPVIKGSMHVVVLYIYDDLSKIKMKVEEEMTGYKKLHPPKSMNVAWRSGDVIIRLFEGPRRHRMLVEKLVREQNFYQVSYDPESFFVEPPIGEANQKPLQFVLGQGSPKSTDAEILIMLRYDDKVQPSPPPSPPQSQTPSSSSSLPQSPLQPPSQPLLPSSLQPSSSESSSPSSVSQGELIKLAEDVPTGKYTELCNNMDSCPANSEQVLNKHSKDYKQALIEIFCAWHVNQETGNSRRLLTDILQKTSLLALADRLQTGHYLPVSTSDFESEEPSGAESEHERDDSAQYPQTSGTRQQQKRKKGSSKGPGKKKFKR